MPITDETVNPGVAGHLPTDMENPGGDATLLVDTDAAAIAKALTTARQEAGAVALGVVLTLVVVTNEDYSDAAVVAAKHASAQHPCRILVVVPQPGDDPRLDASVQVGGSTGPGEAVVMHLFGPLVQHADTVVLPLVAPDTPVVTWWHGPPPTSPATEPLGVLADRRVTDTYLADDPVQALLARRAQYQPGDTDLAWTRLTLWRSVVAAAFDALPGPARSVTITTQTGNPSASLLAAWMQTRLGTHVTLQDGEGPAITQIEVVAEVEGGDGTVTLTVSRPSGHTATLTRTDQPERVIPLPIRHLGDLLAEELRRLDPDEPYADALAAVGAVDGVPA